MSKQSPTNTAFALRSIEERKKELQELATDRYFELYSTGNTDHLFKQAIKGRSHKYANRLIDCAMALCGSPNSSPPKNPGRMSAAAIAFLARFS